MKWAPFCIALLFAWCSVAVANDDCNKGTPCASAVPYIIPTTSGDVTPDWNNGPIQELTATADVILHNPVNPVVGQTYYLSISNNGFNVNPPGGDSCGNGFMPSQWKVYDFGGTGLSNYSCVEQNSGTVPFKFYTFRGLWDGTRYEAEAHGDVSINRLMVFHDYIGGSARLGNYVARNEELLMWPRAGLEFIIAATSASTTVPYDTWPVNIKTGIDALGINVTTFTCSVNPTIVIQDCGTSVPTTCGTPSATVGTSPTITGTGYYDITISTNKVGSYSAKHYLAALFASGTCTAFNAKVNMETFGGD